MKVIVNSDAVCLQYCYRKINTTALLRCTILTDDRATSLVDEGLVMKWNISGASPVSEVDLYMW